MKPSDLIRYIVWYATQREVKLTTVRVVKFVYLADLFYARSTDGKTLTGCPWRFVHYGPYCSEVMAELKQASRLGLVNEDQLESKFKNEDFFLYTCYDKEAEQLESQIPTSVLYPLRESIRLFGDDTQALLDHVYFETEPMEGVRKGELLDFAKATQRTARKLPVIPKLPKQKIEEARKHTERLIEQMEKDSADLGKDSISYPEPMDEIHIRALEIMDGEGVAEGAKGTCGDHSRMSILDLYSPDEYFSPIKTGQWAPGQFCWIMVPNIEEIPKILDVERSRPQEHTEANFAIRPARAANDFKKPDRILPLYYLNLRTSEELLVQRAKKRSGVILNYPLERDAKLAAGLTKGQKHQHDRSLFVIPCYGADNEERRGGFLPEICQRAKYLVYRRYFYVPDYPKFKVREGVWRFDRIQVITGKHPAAIVPMDFAFSREIFAIFRAMFFYCITGERNPDLQAIRELLVEQYQKHVS